MSGVRLPRGRAAVWLFTLVAIPAAACGSSSESLEAMLAEPGAEEVVDDEVDAGSTEEPQPEPEPEPEPGAEPQPEPEPEPEATRDDYVTAVAELFEGGPAGAVDVDCVGSGLVDAIGVKTLAAAGVEPDDLRFMDSVVELGITPTPQMRADVTAVFDRCMDQEVIALEVMGSLGLEFPEEVVGCVAEAMAGLTATAVVDEFIDGLDALEDAFTQGMELGAQCRVGLVLDLPGAGVTWADGLDAFSTSLRTMMATPVIEGTAALTDEESACFTPAVLVLLGPALAEVPGVTVAELFNYLSAAVAPASIGLSVDEETAIALAEANAACIDQALVTARSLLPAMESAVGEVDLDAFADCLRVQLTDELLLGSLVLQYRYGVEMFVLPEAERYLSAGFAAGEVCMLEMIELSDEGA